MVSRHQPKRDTVELVFLRQSRCGLMAFCRTGLRRAARALRVVCRCSCGAAEARVADDVAVAAVGWAGLIDEPVPRLLYARVGTESSH